MRHPFRYIGFFVSFDELHKAVDPIRKEPLSDEIAYPHITFQYKPHKVDPSLLGKKVNVVIEGYGNDGVNEGVRVRLESEDPQLQDVISKIEVPHITIAIGEEGKAVNTRFLSFEPVEPRILTGVFGGYVKQGDAVACTIQETREWLQKISVK